MGTNEVKGEVMGTWSVMDDAWLAISREMGSILVESVGLMPCLHSF